MRGVNANRVQKRHSPFHDDFLPIPLRIETISGKPPSGAIQLKVDANTIP